MLKETHRAICKKVALTGFMGVGKSSVARHLASITGWRQIDLDEFIERSQSQSIDRIIEDEGLEHYRSVESGFLQNLLMSESPEILSLGGGTWTIARNREMIKSAGYLTVWLEASFDHCWQNISRSRKKRPLARNRASAAELFEERRSVYCLADWHIVIRPGLSSFDVARQIAEEMFF
ncbi:MAG: hypothetical protein C4324_03355 [Blastocatellia bacterium]